eukprot:gnl/TRDRNA2_/TRDRNA2_149934_c1_seq1.p1 gnl/TRDRNA2_/TRDRNA2_149934_c1~~gnl/TRDRNA2_/TRDRNA2_149934_c1_seq1.p1  ORF type:complete len:497 (+),score=86.92 gnl/TRDRNA2_/TRDRNA2_149934_c1_seq1:2-1492(+)
MYGLAITGWVCLVLCVASMFFAADANRLVLHPVENMINKVEIIRDSPLSAVKMADEEFKAEESAKAKKRKYTRMMRSRSQLEGMDRIIGMFLCTPKTSGHQPMETVILEKTIIKLGSLLALGFGEAGANIINHIMTRADTAGVNAMIPGQRVECIVGFARILNFSVATEVLQSRVMTFVNQVAEIVHGIVDEFHGAANRNNGDTFLLIWRTTGLPVEKVHHLADLSIVSFSKTLGALHQSDVLASYRGHPGLQQKLGSNYRVGLSFGLHCGWAIEGAVGSEFKIDASYLSPNVAIASTVEQVTQMYGVSILTSESVIRLCTQEVAAKCRLVDRVLVSGSANPLQLYTVDLDYSVLAIQQRMNVPLVWNTRQRFKARQFLECEKISKLRDDMATVNLFDGDPVIAAMRKSYSVEFFNHFKMGYQNYIAGEWPVAKRMFERTRYMLGFRDGPSAALLNFMEWHMYVAPDGWQGIRELSQQYSNTPGSQVQQAKGKMSL